VGEAPFIAAAEEREKKFYYVPLQTAQQVGKCPRIVYRMWDRAGLNVI
jgi:hypothetical protein